MTSGVKLVIVTGSSRAGTTTTAGILDRLGLHVPQPEVEPNPVTNVRMFEPRWVDEFHRRLLTDSSVKDTDTRPYAASVVAAAAPPELPATLRAWLQGHATSPQVLIADHRITWTFAQWAEAADAIGATTVALIVVSHPTELRRDVPEPEAGHRPRPGEREVGDLAGWFNATLEAERVTRGRPRAFIRHADLLADWRTAVRRAAALAGIDFSADPHHHEQGVVDQFVDLMLPPARRPWHEMHVSIQLRLLAERAWGAVIRLVTDPTDAATVDRLDSLREEYLELFAMAQAISADYADARAAETRRLFEEYVALTDRGRR